VVEVSRETTNGRANITQVCRAFRISRQAYYAAKSGLAKPRALRPERKGPWATAAELEAAVRSCAEKHSSWGVRKVHASLRRSGTVASKKRVWGAMNRLGLVLPAPERREEGARRGSVAVPESNRRWATDLTTVWTRKDGLVAVVPVIDCGDRVVLACDVTRSQETRAALACLVRALREQFGTTDRVPPGLELRSDHGPQYTGGDCHELCELWQLDHTFAPVGRPTGNAVAERFILTMKSELIWTRDWESAAELKEALIRWLIEYHAERPHQALAWQTPFEKRAANLGLPVEAAA
jgi:transposase InsO family protein